MAALTPEWLGAFSRAANLPPLNTGTSELRIWVDKVMFRDLTGFVISESGLVECHTRWDLKASVVIVKTARCRPRSAYARQHDVLRLLPELAQLNGQGLGCAARDHGDVFVEGMASGQRFTFSASNQPECPDAGSRLVTKLLGLVR